MLLLGAYPKHTLLWSSFPLRSELLAPTRLTLDHPLPHLSNAAYMCVFHFYPYPLSSVLSLTLFTHLNHSYLLSPHVTFHDSESAYSFYIYLPPMFSIRVHLCAGPTLNHVVL